MACAALCKEDLNRRDRRQRRVKNQPEAAARQCIRCVIQRFEEKLSNGETCLTVDEALVNWEIENKTEDEREETLQAIQLGLDDM
jgi:hypothetical protein